MYGCRAPGRPGSLGRMTTHRASAHRAPARRAPIRRAPESARPTGPGRPVERAVSAVLVLAVLAGIGWIAGMIWTLAEWRG